MTLLWGGTTQLEMKMKEVSLEEKGVQIRLKGNRLHFRLIKNDKKNNKNTILLFNNSKKIILSFFTEGVKTK